MTPLFNLNEFSKRHDPQQIANLILCSWMYDFPNYAMRILDMPVKRPHEDLHVPTFARKFLSFIDVCVYDAMQQADDYYAYLTVDQGLVKAHTGQRAEGAHVDGFQGIRIKDALPHDFSYCSSDALPTIFYKQTWDVTKLDRGRDNFFLEFDRQAQEEAAWQPRPYDVVRFDAYSVHRSAFAKMDTLRTFLRLSFSVREFDRLGNSINPLLPTNWKYVSRSVSKDLK